MCGYSLGLYEKAIPSGMDFPEMLELTQQCGFDRLEISIDESDDRLARLNWSEGRQAALFTLCHETGVAIKTMCLSGHRRYPLGSHEKTVREQSVDIMRRAIDFCANAGISLIQLAGYDVYYETGDETTRQYFFENLCRSAEYAASRGVALGFETMETPFMDTVEKAMAYVSRVNSAWLGVYPDIGNLKNAAVLYGTDVVEDLQKGEGHIFAGHLKETRPGVYRNMQFGEGHTEYQRNLVCLLGMGVRMFTGEFWYQDGQDYRTVISASNKFLREKIFAAGKELGLWNG